MAVSTQDMLRREQAANANRMNQTLQNTYQSGITNPTGLVNNIAQNNAANTNLSTASTAGTSNGGGADYFQIKIGGKTYNIKPDSSGGYLQAYKIYEAQKNNSFNNLATNLKNTLASNNAQTNANYNNSARQAYVNYMRNQKALPSQLQALGVNGGATESGLLNLFNNYGNEHAANEQQRAAELAKNQFNYDDAYFKARQALDDDLAAQQQTAINNQIQAYKDELTKFQASIVHYPTTAKGYDSYGKEIKKLQNGNDPLKKYKIDLLKNQRSIQFPSGRPTEEVAASSGGGGGGGGGGGYSRSYSSGGGGGNNNTSASPVAQKYSSAIGPKKSSSNSSKTTKSIKGDTYYVTKKGSYRSK